MAVFVILRVISAISAQRVQYIDNDCNNQAVRRRRSSAVVAVEWRVTGVGPVPARAASGDSAVFRFASVLQYPSRCPTPCRFLQLDCLLPRAHEEIITVYTTFC
jgi:hypothetical protein